MSEAMFRNLELLAEGVRQGVEQERARVRAEVERIQAAGIGPSDRKPFFRDGGEAMNTLLAWLDAPALARIGGDE